ncbi:MAG: tyrosine-type recombinase/integrase [Actinomycetota bacterium]|nr:tyrosine-type recombinase/integrase [Actinomycetota bacterium]
MSALADAAAEYLQLRRSLGYKLADVARLLPRFVAYLDATGVSTVTVAAALDWACQPPIIDPTSTVWSRRMTAARGFALWLSAVDARTEVPPAGLISCPAHRAVPYLYSPDDVDTLLHAARSLPSALRGATYEALIGLLVVTGMRIGEAIGLDRRDLDGANRVVVVRASKFNKSRELALHNSAHDALVDYARRRDELCPHPKTTALLVSNAGTRLIYTNVCQVFAGLVRSAGVVPRPPARPRLHDFRHSFAVRTLRDWYAQDVDVQARLPWLSTYLGHTCPASTYWYLSASPELLGLAARRLEARERP